MSSAEKHFKRLRLMNARDETMLRFYVEQYREKKNWSRLLSTLQSLRDIVKEKDEQIRCAFEMAEVAEQKLGKKNKAIDVWKWILRRDPGNSATHKALYRLYTESKKWNALLDLLKTEIDSFSEEQVEEKVATYREMIVIFQDYLKLDVMVINTHIALLQIAPDDIKALDALAERYAVSSRWNDYVGILTRKTAFVFGESKIELLRLVADTWRTKLGNISRAIPPLEELLELDPKDKSAILSLKEIYSARRDYKKLVSIQQKEIALLAQKDQIPALRDIAIVVQNRLKDEELLASIYKQLVDVTKGEDEDTLANLLEIYERLERWDALVELLQELYDREKTDRTQSLRLAELYSVQMNKPEESIAIWQSLLVKDPGEQEARAQLTQVLYRLKRWDELEELGEQLNDRLPTLDLFEVTAEQVDEEEAIELYRRVAKMANKLEKPTRQTSALEAILRLRADAETMRELVRLYQREKRYQDQANMLERMIKENETADLRKEIAELYASHLENPLLAYEHNIIVFLEDPADQSLRDSLLELAIKSERIEQWFDLLKNRCATMPRGESRTENYRSLARLAIGPIQSSVAAIDFFERVKQELPEDREALDELAKLFKDNKKWPRYLAILQDKKAISTVEERAELAMKAAEVLTLELKQPQEALIALEEVLSINPDSLPALKGLRQTSYATKNWTKVVETCEKELLLLNEKREKDAEKIEILSTITRTLTDELDNISKALPFYKKLLSFDKKNELVLSAINELVDLLDDQDYSLDAAELLESVLQELERWDDFVILIEAQIEQIDIASDEKRSLFKKLARVQKDKLEEAESAYYTYCRALNEIVPDLEIWTEMLSFSVPELLQADQALRWVAAAEYHTPDAIVEVLPELAKLQESTNNDFESARLTYNWILQVDPDDNNALDGLERILAELHDYEALANILITRADEGSVASRAARLREAAQLRQKEGRSEDSTLLLEEILTFDPENSRVYEDLEALYILLKRFDDLSELYLSWLTFADEILSPRLELRRGRIAMSQLEEIDLAITCFINALGKVPTDPDVNEALKKLVLEGENHALQEKALQQAIEIFRKQHSWEELAQWTPLRIHVARSNSEKITILSTTAELLRIELDRPSDAFEMLKQAIELDASQREIRMEADGLAAQLDRWEELVILYETGLSSIEEVDKKFKLAMQLGDIYRDELLDVENAIITFSTASSLIPSNDLPLANLDELYAVTGKDEERIAILLTRSKLVEGEAQLNLYKEAVHLTSRTSSDPERAISVLEELRSDFPEDVETLEALYTLYTKQNDWNAAIEALHDVIASLREQKDKVHEKQVLLANLLDSLDDAEGAIQVWNELRAETEDPNVLLHLDRLYGRLGQAEKQEEILIARIKQSENSINKTITSENQNTEATVQISTVKTLSFKYRLAELYIYSLQHYLEAIEVCKEILEEFSQHKETILLLEAFIDDFTEIDTNNANAIFQALLLLENTYEKLGKWEDLVRILEIQVGYQEHEEKLLLFDRIAELYETKLDDLNDALSAILDGYMYSNGDSSRCVNVERLVQKLDAWEYYVKVCESLIDQVDTTEKMLELHRIITQIYSEKLNNEEKAIHHYKIIIGLVPDDLGTLRLLDGYYERGKQWKELVAILDQEVFSLDLLKKTYAITGEQNVVTNVLEQHKIITSEQEAITRKFDVITNEQTAVTSELDVAINEQDVIESEQIMLLHRRAMIQAKRLNQFADAVITLERSWKISPENEKTFDYLVELLSRQNDWFAVIDVISRFLDHVSIDKKLSLRFRTAELRRMNLQDLNGALDDYEELMAEYGIFDGVAAALWQIFVAEEETAFGLRAAILLEPIVRKDRTTARIVRVLQARAQSVETQDRSVIFDELAAIFTSESNHIAAFKALRLRLEIDPSERAKWEQFLLSAQLCQPFQTKWEIVSETLEDGIVNTDDSLAPYLSYQLAKLLAERLNNSEQARFILDDLLVEESFPKGAEELLERILHQDKAWEELASFYQQQAKNKQEDSAKAMLLEKVARLQQDFVQDQEEAVNAYQALLEVRVGDASAISAIERILKDSQQWSELADFWRQQAANLSGNSLAKMQTQLGDLYLNELNEPGMAIGALEQALSVIPTFSDAIATLEKILLVAQQQEDSILGMRVSGLLEPLYDPKTDLQSLVNVYEAQCAASETPTKIVNALTKLGSLYKAHKKHDFAFDAFARALRTEPNNDEICLQLTELINHSEKWQRLDALYREILSEGVSIIIASQLRMRIASLYEKQLHKKMTADNTEDNKEDVNRIIEIYQELLTEDERHLEASIALEKLLKHHEHWADLVEVLSNRLHIVDEQEKRCELHIQLAEVFEKQLNNPESAEEEYRDLLAEEPDNVDALFALERLYSANNNWNDLITILMHKVDISENVDERRNIFFQIGTIQAEHLDNPYEAIEAFRIVLEITPNETRAMHQLAELYEHTQEWSELTELLEQTLSLSQETEKTAILLQIAQISWEYLDDPNRAISSLEQILALDPTCEAALELLKEFLADDNTVQIAIEMLEPIFRKQNSYKDLLNLLNRKTTTTHLPTLRCQIFTEMGDIAETNLQDSKAAFEWNSHALTADPSDQNILEKVMRLAKTINKISSIIPLFENILNNHYQVKVSSQLNLIMAKIQQKELGDLSAAKENYLRVLEYEENNQQALSGLENIFVETNDFENLADILARRITNISLDSKTRTELQCRLASLNEDELDDPMQAFSIYNDVLLDSPNYSLAIEGLLRLIPVPETAEIASERIIPILRATEQWDRLIEVLQSRLTQLEAQEHIDTLISIASTYKHIAQKEKALSFYIYAFEQMPTIELFEEIEPLIYALEKPQILVDTVFNMMDSLEEPSIAEPILLAGANVAEQIDDLERQEAFLATLIEISPEHLDALERLELLYRQKNDAARIIDVLKLKSEVIHDNEVRIELFLQMASIAESELQDTQQTQEILEEILLLDPINQIAYLELIRLAEEQKDWATVIEILMRQVDVANEQDIILIRTRIADIALSKLQEPELAIDAYRDILAVEPNNNDALLALAKLFEKQENWDEYHHILRQQLETTDDKIIRASLLDSLSKLSEIHLHDLNGAIEYQQQLVKITTFSDHQAERLEKLLRSTNRWTEVLDILQIRLKNNTVDSLTTQVEMAKIAIEQLHNFIIAEEYLSAVLKEKPKHLLALRTISILFLEQARWEEAQKVLETRLSITHNLDERVTLLYTLADLLDSNLQKTSAAIKYYEAAIVLDSTHIQTLDALERIYSNEQRWESLIGVLLKRVQISSTEQKIKIYLQMANITKEKLQNFPAELSALEHAYKLDKENIKVTKKLLEAYTNTQRFIELRSVLEQLIITLKKSSRVQQRELYLYQHQLGDLAAAANDQEAALQAYLASQHQNASYLPNLVSLGKFYYNSQQWEKSFLVFQSALLNPFTIKDKSLKIDTFYHLGNLRLKRNQIRHAHDMFSRALSVEKDHIQSQKGLELCALRRSQKE